MKRPSPTLTLAACALLVLTAGAALAESRPGDSSLPAPGPSGSFGAPDVTFDMTVVAATPEVQVIFMQGKSASGRVDRAATSYVLVRSGAAAFLQPVNAEVMGSQACWVDGVNAAVVDLGREPGVVVTIRGGKGPQEDYTVARIFGIASGTIDALSEIVTIADRELDTDLSATAPTATGWNRIRIAEAPVKDGQAPALTGTATASSEEPAHYLAFDTALVKYAPEDYTSQFDQQAALETDNIAQQDPPYTAGSASDDYAPDTAWFQVGVEHARLRDAPSTQAGILRVLTRGTAFEILDRTDDPQAISGVTERWYKVLLRDGSGEGWLFGGVIKRRG